MDWLNVGRNERRLRKSRFMAIFGILWGPGEESTDVSARMEEWRDGMM